MSSGFRIRFGGFKYNHAVETAIRRSTQMREVLAVKSDAGAEAARAAAPVRTGAYRDSIHGDVVMSVDGFRGRIIADDWKAGFVEWGTIHNAAHHPLQRGARAVGLRFQGR